MAGLMQAGDRFLERICVWVIQHGNEAAGTAAIAALVTTFCVICLVVYILVLRLRTLTIERRRRELHERWRPILIEAITVPDDFSDAVTLPPLKRSEFEDFIELVKHLAVRIPIPERRRLKTICDTLGVTQTFMRGLKSGSAWERARAALMCGYLRVTESIPDLLEMAHDPDPLVVYDATRALGMMGEPKVVKQVVAVICRQEGWSRAKIIELLLEFGPDVALETLRQFLSGNVARNWMLPMVEIMGHFRVIEARPALEVVVRGDDEDLSHAAIRALGRIGMPSSDWVLRGCLTHATPRIRRAAAEALGACMATKAELDLVDLLSDADVSVRQSAAVALLGFGERSRDKLWSVSAKPGRENLARDTAAWVLQRASWTSAV